MNKWFWIFWIVAVPLIVGGLVMGYGSWHLLQTGATAQGSVVDITSSTSTSRDSKTGQQTISKFFYPTVEFKTADGKTARFTSKLGNGNQPGYEIGQSVEVLYMPDNPADAKIKSGMELWFAPCMMILFGGIWIVIWFICKKFLPKDPDTDFAKDLLPTFGETIVANIVSIEQLSRTAPASDDPLAQAPWIIRAEWNDPKTNKPYRFASKPIPKDPRGRVGTTINVRVLPSGADIYEIDTTALI